MKTTQVRKEQVIKSDFRKFFIKFDFLFHWSVRNVIFFFSFFFTDILKIKTDIVFHFYYLTVFESLFSLFSLTYKNRLNKV